MKLTRQSSHQPSAVSRELPAAGLRTSDFGLRTSRSGVALVITVIMLSVILFMAITFLALSRREKGVVATTKDMTLAKFAMDGGIERAKGEMLANILGTTNVSSFSLLVSTNFIRWEGFDPAAGNNMNWQAMFPPTVNGFTNVNFDYLPNGNPLSIWQRLQNLTNLYFSPRPPVWVTNATRGVAGSYDFRYYLDLNRNGRHDRSGYWPVTNVDSSGNPFVAVLPNGQWVSNYMVGDPEWIGELERPGFPHSATNKFLSRYCFMVVPAGKTLDVNYIHNQTLADRTSQMNVDGKDFSRNQGVGSWEINLASFLYDLNTNKYAWGYANNGYIYDQPVANPVWSSGKAFEDAAALYRYRLNGNPSTLTYAPASVSYLFGNNGANAFRRDFLDGYSDDVSLFSTNGVGQPSAGLTADFDRPGNPWPGAPLPNHFFSQQDLFNPAKTTAGGAGFKFPDRLSMASTNLSTYDSYTFYRMLSQLGTDSAYEDTDKLNLNYVNVGGFAATNFIRWDDASALGVRPSQVALVMFNNVANRLLSRYTQDWLDNDRGYYQNFFGTNQPFDATSIPVWFSNRMVYSPSVHRLLQLAANITDSVVTNRGFDPSLPSVFRPIIRKSGNAIHITGFTEDGGNVQQRLKKPLAMDNPAEFAAIQPDSNIYGVPWIIGAKKGFPNFNEFAMETVFEMTRKIQISRSSAGAMSTNLMYVVGVSNAIATEVWNSYATNYPRGVGIFVNNEITMALTNDAGTRVPLNYSGPASLSNAMSFSANQWRGYQKGHTNSFAIPMRTNLVVQRPATYLFATAKFAAGVNEEFEKFPGFPQPNWGLQVSNRMRFFMVDQPSGRVIDYVQLDSLNSTRNLSEEVRESARGRAGGDITVFNRMWVTNRIGNLNSFLVPTVGISNQIWVSANTISLKSSEWADVPGTYGEFRTGEVAKFAAFLTNGAAGTFQVPFTPTKRMSQPITWQANDPLVHYTSGDLVQVANPNGVNKLTVNVAPQLLKNISQVNNRFNPWGGNPEKVPGNEDTMETDSFYNAALKDPLVKGSDDWEFHTNAFPNIGWLGRVHRGTPWQTVYLKADDIGIANLNVPAIGITNRVNTYTNAQGKIAAREWAIWSGNPNILDGYHTRPATDRVLFDIFTTALNENATRGQLPINQEGLAAWSAVLGGVVAITNATTDVKLNSTVPNLKFDPLIIQPAGAYDPAAPATWPAIAKIVNGINTTRTNLGMFPSQSFKHLGDVLATPELTTASPFLNRSTQTQVEKGLNDAAYEWIPQQIMSLLRVGEPRFVVYAYGQTLHPADNSIYLGGNLLNGLQPFNGLCTNYQVTAETAARAVVRVEGSPDPVNRTNANPKLRYPPRLVVESYNVLGPD